MRIIQANYVNIFGFIQFKCNLFMWLGCSIPVFSSVNSGIIDVSFGFSAPVCTIGIAAPAPYTRIQVVCAGTIPGTNSQVHNLYRSYIYMDVIEQKMILIHIKFWIKMWLRLILEDVRIYQCFIFIFYAHIFFLILDWKFNVNGYPYREHY